MRYALSVVALALTSSLPLLATNPGERPGMNRISAQIQEAEKLLQRYKYEKATTLLEPMTETLDDPSYEAFQLLAEANLALGRYPETLAAADSMAAAADGAEQRGQAFSLLGRALFERSVSEQSDFYSPGSILERLLETLKSTDSSEQMMTQLRASLEEKDKFEGLQKTLLEEAAAALRQAIELRDDSALPDRYLLAEVLTRLDRVDEARAQLDEYFALADGSEIPVGPRELQCRLDSGVIDGLTTGGVEPPRRTHKEPAGYTRKAARQKIRGQVFLEAVIDEQGRVRCTRPLRGLPLGLTQRAIRAIEKSKFEPARLGDEPIAVAYRFTVHFWSGRPPTAADLQRRRLSPFL